MILKIKYEIYSKPHEMTAYKECTIGIDISNKGTLDYNTLKINLHKVLKQVNNVNYNMELTITEVTQI